MERAAGRIHLRLHSCGSVTPPRRGEELRCRRELAEALGQLRLPWHPWRLLQ